MIPPDLRESAERFLRGRGTILAPEGWELLELYLRDVLDYNKRTNLTAARGFDEAFLRHGLDALAADAPLKALCPGDSPLILDAGAGAGFVGIALKIARPGAEFALLESVYRKVCFLNWTTARLGLRGLRVIHGRAEDATIRPLTAAGGGTAPVPGPFDAVVSRALSPLPQAAAMTLPLARPGGAVLVFQSAPPDPAEPGLAAALSDAGASLEDVYSYRLPSENKDRTLVLLRRNA